MPWRAVLEQRVEFCRLAGSGVVPVAELCRRFGVSRKTAYKWLSRFETDGEAGLVDRSRRLHSSSARTGGEMEGLVCRVREAFPAWGGRKIRGFLLRQGHAGVPAASTITRILRRRGGADDHRRPAGEHGYGCGAAPGALAPLVG